jgi:hypothetical protein
MESDCFSRNADAPLATGDGNLWFVRPKEEMRPFKEVLDTIQQQEVGHWPSGTVFYAQTRMLQSQID